MLRQYYFKLSFSYCCLAIILNFIALHMRDRQKASYFIFSFSEALKNYDINQDLDVLNVME